MYIKNHGDYYESTKFKQFLAKNKKAYKKVFAEMLNEKRELGKISVSELCKRADISRGAFYSHYDDIYGVAEDYENEMIDTFFDNARLLESQEIPHFIDSIFEFIRQNNENYRLLCRSNDFLFAAKKLTAIASGKLLELCLNDNRIKKKEYIYSLICKFFLRDFFVNMLNTAADIPTKHLTTCTNTQNTGSRLSLNNGHNHCKYTINRLTP